MLISYFNAFLIVLVTFLTYKYFELREKTGPGEDRYAQLVSGVSSIVDRIEGYDHPHSSEVADLSVRLGAELGLNDDQLQVVSAAAMLHDVGEMLLPRDILRTRKALDQEELELLHTHPLLGELHLKSRFSGPDEVPSIIRWHHERWDGLGYPDNLKGSEIPRAARIIALADAVSAMTRTRDYRSKNYADNSEIAAELQKYSGLQFDPDVVAAWLKINGLNK
jgi:HD-GYP domain-containing protein (c-di-GMP phosphodiesterase class II)